MKDQEIVVLCTFRPKAGRTQALLELLEDHVPTLRRLGFATGYPRSLLTSENGTVIEIFAWASEEASRAANDHPEVRKIWDQVAAVADYVPLSDLAETKKPFAHFQPVENPRRLRPMWFEIPADDPKRCSDFYQKVFGWETSQFPGGDYWVVDTGREPAPGIDGGISRREHPAETVRNTVIVKSVDEFIGKIEKAGGKISVPKTKIENVGFIAYAKDTEGNTFGILQPARG